MLRNKAFVLSTALFLLVCNSVAMALPGSMTAVFEVYRGNMSVGNLKSSLKYQGTQYQYHKSTQATGLAKLLTGASVVENSDGTFIGDKLTPTAYLYDEKTRSKSRIERTRFAGNRATGVYKDKSYTVNTPPNVLDRASLELAVARDLQNGVAQLSYQVFERGEVKNYSFTRLGSERLKTNAGTFNTIKVKVKRTDTSRETIYWMAVEMGYLPAKMTHREDDELITSLITQYKAIP